MSSHFFAAYVYDGKSYAVRANISRNNIGVGRHGEAI